MTTSLTFRNLTPSIISLRGLERFEDPNAQQSKANGLLSTSKQTSSLAPSAPKLEQHAQTFVHEDLDVALAPFESYTLDNDRQNPDARDSSSALTSTTIRLTIETSGKERFRIDANPAYTQKSSHSVTPLTPNPTTTYTALYHPSKPTPHLTIHNNHLHDLSNWMASLSSTLPLSALSIPGSHNSHTHYRALPSVRCQNVPVKTQLQNGIRFLDIRVQPDHPTDLSKKDLYLVHGAFPVSLTGPKYLEPVLKACYEFLDQNPTETILISLKREGTGNATDEVLSQILEKHYIDPNGAKWYTEPSIPYLSSVRGKLVLIRRYNLHASSQPSSPDGGGYGLDATAWPHNETNATHGPFCVQDFCEIMHPSSIAAKLQYSNEHLVRSAACTALIPGVNTDVANPVPPGPIHLNFLSGSNFWRVGCWPDRIAQVVNRGVEEWICMGLHLEGALNEPAHPGRTDAVGDVVSEQRDGASVVRRAKGGDGCTGVVIMDYVGAGGDWDLVRMIVGMNMGVTLRVRENGEPRR